MVEVVYKAIVDAIERGDHVALVTIVAARGSTPQRVGAKLLVYEDGRTAGTIGGGCYESDACLKARDIIRTRRAQVVRYDLADDLAAENGLICGGQMDVFIEPIEPSPTLYIVGAGHVGRQVARVAHGVGFRVCVLDDREKFASRDLIPEADDVVVDDIPGWLGRAEMPQSAYVVVVTRGHRHDLAALQAIAGRTARYIGMIGSRAKVARITEALVEAGAPPDWVAALRAPIGLRIGAVTPEEIAVSIVAELIAVRRGAVDRPDAAAQSMRSRIGA